MYTFYFQQVNPDNYKLVAVKSLYSPDSYWQLGGTYDSLNLEELVDTGHRVVMIPNRHVWNTQEFTDSRMFYAKGYRGPSALSAKPEPTQEFIDYANGVQRDYCAEDFGQDPPQLNSVERENSIKFAESAKNESASSPGIGPLPPQASIAPLAGVSTTVATTNAPFTFTWTGGSQAWTYHVPASAEQNVYSYTLTPEEKEAEALRIANSEIAQNAKPNLWSRFVDKLWPF